MAGGAVLALLLVLARGAASAEEKDSAEERPGAAVDVPDMFFPEGVARNLSPAGGWLPVYLELKALSRAPEKVTIEAGVTGDRKKGFTVRETIDVLPGAPRRAWVYLRAGGQGPETGSIEVRTAQGVTVARHLDLEMDSQSDSSRTLSLLVVGEKLGDLKPWPGDLTRPRGRRAELREAAAGCSASKLPDRAIGYGAFDIVILRGTGAEELEPAQLAALDAWVRWGGFLVIVPSTLSGEVFRTRIAAELLGDAYRDPRPVDGFEPQRIHAVTRESSLAAVAAQPIFDVEAERERHAGGDNPSKKLAFTLLDPLAERGEREILSVDGPLGEGVEGRRLYAEVSRGRGKVGVFMFNDQTDRQAAEGLLHAVWGQIVDWNAERPRANPFAGTARLRSRELASFLHDASRDVGLPFIASLVGAYILIVGPGIYFLLKRWNRLPAVIWVEPLVIVGYLGIIFGVAYITKGVRTKVRVWNVISQVDGGRAALRQGFLSIFSGDDATYRIECPRGDILHPIETEREERPVILAREADGRLALEGFHLAHWEQGHLTSLEVMDLEGIRMQISSPGETAAGEERKAVVTNRLPHAVLGGVLYDRRMRRPLPRIEPGASVEVPLPAEAAEVPAPGRRGDAKESREAWENLLSRLEPILQRGLGIDGYPVLVAWIDRRDEDFRLDRASTVRERVDLYFLHGKE
jgi:hypothetical protein